MVENVGIKKSAKRLSEDDIQRLEDRTGIALPKQYREFLLLHNGGEPSRGKFVTRDGKVESWVKKFYPIAETKADNLLEEIEGFTFAGLVPENLIVIAVDPANNRLVLSVSGTDTGKVYYWAWGEEDRKKHKPSYTYMRLIADGFNEFLTSLEDE